MRLIDANALCDCFEKAAYKCEYTEDMVFHLDYILDEITGADEVDAVEVVHARWHKPTPCSQEFCANCGLTPKTNFGWLPPYCPNCGAKMDGGEQ